ncbi:MAG: hypothetical protein WD708_06375 [Kiritimatiellia bacterium]
MITSLSARFLRRLLMGVVLGSGLFHGCVRVEAARDSGEGIRMLVTRDINGVQMQWESVEGKGYTVYYREPWIPKNKWKELPGGVELKGTGEVIRLTDTSEDARKRKYRIETLEPVRKSK